MNEQTVKELAEARDELGKTVVKLVAEFQEKTGHMIKEMSLKLIRTPQGAFQDLDIQVDVFDDLKPKPQSNLVTAQPGQIPNLKKS